MKSKTKFSENYFDDIIGVMDRNSDFDFDDFLLD